jgi:hypothetical protein
MYWDKFGNDFGCDRFGGVLKASLGLILGGAKFWGCLGNKFGADFGWARLGDVLETN